MDRSIPHQPTAEMTPTACSRPYGLDHSIPITGRYVCHGVDPACGERDPSVVVSYLRCVGRCPLGLRFISGGRCDRGGRCHAARKREGCGAWGSEILFDSLTEDGRGVVSVRELIDLRWFGRRCFFLS